MKGRCDAETPELVACPRRNQRGNGRPRSHHSQWTSAILGPPQKNPKFLLHMEILTREHFEKKGPSWCKGPFQDVSGRAPAFTLPFHLHFPQQVNDQLKPSSNSFLSSCANRP